MKLRDARTIPPKELEDRRKLAIKLRKQGMKFSDISEVVGVNRNTISSWYKKWESGGVKAIKVGQPGRRKGSGSTLDKEQQYKVTRCLIQCTPDQLKFDFALWTRAAVQQLIAHLFGIEMPIRTVGHYLKQWGGRGYAPKGKTPIREHKGKKEKINMISTVTKLGKIRFMFYEGSMNADCMIKFMRRLIKDTSKKVFLILDNLRTHHSKKVKSWVAKYSAKIELFYLPSYSPDLNPDEYLNRDLKAQLSNKPSQRKDKGFSRIAKTEMRRLQKQPSRVQKYFNSSSIQYAAK